MIEQTRDLQILAEADGHDGLAAAFRAAQLHRNISNEELDDACDLTRGYTDKVLGPKGVRGLGRRAIDEFSKALAVRILVVADPRGEEIMRESWKPRVPRGGAVLQMRKRQPLLASALSISENRRDYMRALGSKGGKMGGSKGGKGRLKTMSKRARQRAAAHAARMRWAKRATP